MSATRHPADNDPADAQRLVCVQCSRWPREDENLAGDWRAYLDVDDELPVFCPQCAKREFADDADGAKRPN